MRATRGKAAGERVLTLHPEGKAGVRIDSAKYEAMRKAILSVVPRSGEGIAFFDLPGRVKPRLGSTAFEEGDSVMWYVTTVKLDLEARGEIRRVPGARPQRLVKGRAVRRSGR